MKRKTHMMGIAVFFLALSAAMLVSAADNNTSEKTVTIDNFNFSPAVITVPAGTTVRWTNHDDIPHTVVSDDKTTFKSKPLDTDEQFTYTFTKPGTYSYFCSIHPKMTGKVIVQ